MIRVRILTVSDSVAAGTREDRSGPAVAARVAELGWHVDGIRVVPDDARVIARTLIETEDIEVMLTTGGTGVAARDVTPEATRAAIDREIPGLAERMRAEGLRHTPFAPLSRGIAGTRAGTLIVNLPGSPAGAVQSLDAIAHLVPHITDLLAGRTAHVETAR